MMNNLNGGLSKEKEKLVKSEMGKLLSLENNLMYNENYSREGFSVLLESIKLNLENIASKNKKEEIDIYNVECSHVFKNLEKKEALNIKNVKLLNEMLLCIGDFRSKNQLKTVIRSNERITEKLGRDLSEKEFNLLVKSTSSRVDDFVINNDISGFMKNIGEKLTNDNLLLMGYIMKDKKVAGFQPLFDGYYWYIEFDNGENSTVKFMDILIKNDKDNILNEPMMKSLIEKYDRLRFLSQQTETLVQYNGAGINLSPVYQRELVWEQEDKEKLIDSLMIGKDIGKFLLYREPNNYGNEVPLYEMIDGKQRFTTIIDFFSNKFPYKGKFFAEMNGSERHKIESCPINVGIVEGKMDLKDRIDLFLVLNTSGKSMSFEDLEKARKLLIG